MNIDRNRGRTPVLGLLVCFVAAVLASRVTGQTIALDMPPAVGIGATEQLIFRADGGQAVSAFEVNVQIGDGGAALGGDDVAPTIVGIELVNGTIFASGQTPTQSDPVASPLAAQSAVDIADTVAASGTVAVVTLNTAALNEGETFNVSLTNVGGDTDTKFFDANGDATAIPAASFQITAGAVDVSPLAVPLATRGGLMALAVVVACLGASLLYRRQRRAAGSVENAQ